MGRQVNHKLIRCHRALLCLPLAIHVFFRLLVVAEWRPQITLNIHSAILQVFWDRPTRNEYGKAEETIWRHFSKLNLFLAARILSLGSRLAFILAYARFAWNDTPSFAHFTRSGNSWYNVLETTFPREATPLSVNQPPLIQSNYKCVLVLAGSASSNLPCMLTQEAGEVLFITKHTNRKWKSIATKKKKYIIYRFSKYLHHKYTKIDTIGIRYNYSQL